MMFSVTETVFMTTIEMAVTLSTEMTVVTVTVSTEEILETIIEMVVTAEKESNKYQVEQLPMNKEYASVMYFPTIAKR